MFSYAVLAMIRDWATSDERTIEEKRRVKGSCTKHTFGKKNRDNKNE